MLTIGSVHKSSKCGQLPRFIKRENTRNKWPVDALMDLSPRALTMNYVRYKSDKPALIFKRRHGCIKSRPAFRPTSVSSQKSEWNVKILDNLWIHRTHTL